jgi:hypothetical protein
VVDSKRFGKLIAPERHFMTIFLQILGTMPLTGKGVEL